MPQYLNILLQKNDVNLKWGFEVAGGGRTGVPLIITKIHPNSFCSQYLSPEDRIIRIEGIDVELLSEAEAVSFIKKPGRSLNLLIHKHAPTVCRQHNAGDDSSSESSSSSSSTALRHANVRSSFRSYFEHKCNPSQHDPIVSSPTSTPNESSRNAYYSPSSPRVTTKWTRESTTAAPANAESRPNHVSWWDTGASSSSYSPSTLEDDSENDRSHEDNRLRADDKVDAGDKWGRHTDMTFSSSRMVNMGDTNDAVTVNSSGKGKLTEATTTATANFGHYKNNLQSKSRKAFTVRSVRDDGDDKRNVSRVYLSPFGAKINLNDPKASHGFNKIGRQSSQTADTNSPSPAPPPNSICTVPIATNAGIPPPPPAPPTPSSAPMPPPPPPPALNGGAIPTFRLQSEIPERLEPPAKLQNAMMKDKKPFTYTPGGIDLSEIKSPRMARRVMRNAQEPEDIVLPPPTSTPASTASLPPSAYAAMCPQIAIPVFPQNSIGDRKLNHCQRNGHVAQSSPPPPPHRPTTPVSLPSPTPKMVSASTVSPAPPKPASTQNGAVTTDTRPKTAAMTAATNNTSQTQAGSIYVPPVSENDSGKSKPSPPTFPTLREAPTPWLNKHQQQQQPENVPAWRTRNNQKTVTKDAEQEDKLGSVQIKVNIEPNSNQSTNGTRIIPIKIGGAAPKINQSKRWGSAKDNNETVQSSINSTNNNINNNNNNKNKNNNNNNSNNRAAEPESKPIQSRSFKVLQKITGSEDDSTDVPYNSEGVPLSQLRKLHLNDDDQAFMNKVKAQVDEDTFLHMETDPRYRGSVIPSRAFRMLQNMTDSGQVTSNNVVVIPVNHTTQNQTMQPHPARSAVDVHTQAPPSQAPPSQQITIQREIETKKNYIPPSERQAEQDLRKYMGSSIPSRSFRMLQAMTATQDSTENISETATNIDEENVLSHIIPFLPNPWSTPPNKPADVHSLWQNYRILYDFVFQQLPHLFTQHCSKDDTTVPCNVSRPEGLEPDHKNSTNIAIVVTDEKNSSTRTALDVHRPSSSMVVPNRARKLKPHFHSKILQQPHHDTKEALIITQTLSDNIESDNDISVTVRIPLRRKSSTPDEFHCEMTLSKSFFTNNAIKNQNGTKISPFEPTDERNTCDQKPHARHSTSNFYPSNINKKLLHNTDCVKPFQNSYFGNQHPECIRNSDGDNNMGCRNKNHEINSEQSKMHNKIRNNPSYTLNPLKSCSQSSTSSNEMSRNSSSTPTNEHIKISNSSKYVSKPVQSRDHSNHLVDEENHGIRTTEFIQRNDFENNSKYAWNSAKSKERRCNNSSSSTSSSSKTPISNHVESYAERNICDDKHCARNSIELCNKSNTISDTNSYPRDDESACQQMSDKDDLAQSYIQCNFDKLVKTVDSKESCKRINHLGNHLPCGSDSLKYSDETTNVDFLNAAQSNNSNSDETKKLNVENLLQSHKWRNFQDNISNDQHSVESCDKNRICSSLFQIENSKSNSNSDPQGILNSKQSPKQSRRISSNKPGVMDADSSCKLSTILSDNSAHQVPKTVQSYDQNRICDNSNNIIFGNTRESKVQINLSNNNKGSISNSEKYGDQNNIYDNSAIIVNSASNDLNTFSVVGDNEIQVAQTAELYYPCSTGTNKSVKPSDSTVDSISHAFGDVPNSENRLEGDDLSDTDDDHSNASSVDFWKEIAENEDDLFYKTSRNKSAEKVHLHPSNTQQQTEAKRNTWNIGDDVKNFCNYSILSDSTDTPNSSSNSRSSSSSSSSRSSSEHDDSIDLNNQNEAGRSSNSGCSSDENDSFNVYEFEDKEMSEMRPPREDSKAEFTHLADDDNEEDMKKRMDGSSDMDEDSGMNSDTGKNFSETDVEAEGLARNDSRKPSIEYKRAGTHSRLYRLLVDANENKCAEKTGSSETRASKQSLLLPLNGTLSLTESMSSGINSPMSPVVSEKLVNELVQNLLKWENGLDLGKFSPEKLREIAIRSLQQSETTDSSRSGSPYLMGSEAITTISRELARNVDSRNSHNECGNGENIQDHNLDFDIFPSPAFKNLQSGRNNALTTWPKCPLVSPTSYFSNKQNTSTNGTSKR